MPGARSRVKPLPAIESSGSSASDEGSQLELHLQRQLEEDVARIFDESIYSDLEVVCGKLKILTHSCILKARTHKFYHKLEAILHVNIGRNTFDEIYSFISDAYTECNIQHQEKEIINYLNETLNLVTVAVKTPIKKPEDKEDTDLYSTPNCVSPEEKKLNKTLSSSPSTELTKEYYALVPIDNNILDKELIEQDALSNAFQSIIKSQIDDINEKQIKQCIKPTSLFLNSSHLPKINKHSNNSCDTLKDSDSKNIDNIKKVEDFDEKKVNEASSQIHEITKKIEQNSNIIDTFTDKVLDNTYSPDSLITDDPSSSSDYVSAAYAVSPSVIFSSGFSQLNVGENPTIMENIITISDSGLENIGMLESLNSHKDVTLTDVSLTESTCHEMINDDGIKCNDSSSSAIDKKQIHKLRRSSSLQSAAFSGTSSGKDLKEQRSNKAAIVDMSGTSSKEEKQRQNEEIVILESSSLSSETGSWESVFPPKISERDICESFINSERQSAIEADIKRKPPEISNTRNELCPSLVQKSPFKSTSCFIDAASLVDEGDDALTVHTETNETKTVVRFDNMLPEASRPVPCTFKRDLSPNDWSESNDNEDSLEQAENKDQDSIQKDLSPTIFEMTPITEDSLCANTFETVAEGDQQNPKPDHNPDIDTKSVGDSLESRNIFVSSTPNNSIISLGGTDFKRHESEESESDTTVVRHDVDSHTRINVNKHVDFSPIPSRSPRIHQEFSKLLKSNDSPIISGGASVEDHLPQLGSSHSGSPLTRRKIENIPIVSGAYIPEKEEKPEKPPKASSNAPAWVVDMSSNPKSEIGEYNIRSNKKPINSSSKSTCSGETCKSRSSVDSDSSEKSTHKFYIDLSTLPDAMASEQTHESDDSNEKKNIFSMFIDLGDKSTAVKEMPVRLSSALNSKKINKSESKCTINKISKSTKAASLPSVAIRTDDSTMFEKLESLCNDPNISISEIIRNPDSHTEDENEIHANELSISRGFHNEILTEVIKEESNHENNGDLFVKLSDLDKPALKVEAVAGPMKLDGHERMTRSIPDKDCRESSLTNNLRCNDVISSFHSENALSLNRLFPHLMDELSRSMPGSLSCRTRSPLRLGVSSSPGDIEEQASDMSEMSSVQSSYCRSVVENSTTEETNPTSNLISSCQSRLGQDLLRMFVEEIAPDVIVEVSGQRIKAHKCILSSRCQYFAGILSGGWVESAGNVIALPPFSFNVVHFALCHIYSGVLDIPESVSIVELATIADMLSLEGLKEAIMFTLKAKYCHHFHKPCSVCTVGVLECFPLSSVYGLDDLYRKCLRWITKHFQRVWPTKAFATLPSELLDKCFQEHIVNLTADNIVETVYGCGMTVASLQNSRWSETVARMCRRLVNAAAHFAAPRLGAILATMARLPAEAPPPAMQALDDCMAAAIEWAPPDEACRAYAFLSALVREIRTHHYSKPDLISNGNQNKAEIPKNLLYSHASGWRLQCEGALVRAAPRVVGTQAFKDLPADLRKRLRELGCIMFGTQAVPGGASASPQMQRKTKSVNYGRSSSRSSNPAVARSLDIDQVRASFVPYTPKPQLQVGSVDLLPAVDPRAPKTSRGNPPKVRTTKAQEERAKFNSIKTSQPQSGVNCKPATTRAAYENAKPRYLEPRAVKEEKKIPLKKPAPKMVSSSESSRNSSPIQARKARTSRMEARKACEARAQAVSQDSLATVSRPRTADPSTDSLTESQNSNKYATFTKVKHVAKRSVESVQPPMSHANSVPTTKTKTTKIPVYLNQTLKSANGASATSKDAQRRVLDKRLTMSVSPLSQPRNKVNERKPSGSLMNATKSSSAKMVPKIVKETHNTKHASKQEKQAGKHGKQGAPRSPTASDIPVMERSGTFLKDEPMFGDKTTNIDIDE